MWNVKTKVIPGMIGVTGSISKSSRKYLSNIPGMHEIEGTVHTLRKVLVGKYRTFKMGSNITRAMNCNYTIAATRYTLETRFVSGVQL